MNGSDNLGIGTTASNILGSFVMKTNCVGMVWIALATVLVTGPNAHAGQILLDSTAPVASFPYPRADILDAADGNIETLTYTTNVGQQPASAWIALDFDGTALTDVNRIRLFKDSDSGCGACGLEKDIIIQFTTDGGLLSDRNWNNVSGLTNGFNGIELLSLGPTGSVNSNGEIFREDHNPGDGFASLSFNTVAATGVAIQFLREGPGLFNGYNVGEFEAHIPEPATALLTGMGLIVLLRLRR